MSIPDGLRFTPEHEWVSIEGTLTSIGITEYAAQQLGDVVYVSLPPVGTNVTAGEPVRRGRVGQSVSDLYSPVDGEVTDVTRGAGRRSLAGQRRAVQRRVDVPGAGGPGWQRRPRAAARPAVGR